MSILCYCFEQWISVDFQFLPWGLWQITKNAPTRSNFGTWCRSLNNTFEILIYVQTWRLHYQNEWKHDYQLVKWADTPESSQKSILFGVYTSILPSISEIDQRPNHRCSKDRWRSYLVRSWWWKLQSAHLQNCWNEWAKEDPARSGLI